MKRMTVEQQREFFIHLKINPWADIKNTYRLVTFKIKRRNKKNEKHSSDHTGGD